MDYFQRDGWELVPDRGFGQHVGPFWTRRRAGQLEFGVQLAERHQNGLGRTHGGLLATLADSTLGWTIMHTLDGRAPGVTIQLELQFIDAALPGDFVIASARVLRRTRYLAFAEGSLQVGDRIVLRANGIWRLPAESLEALR